jgi:hypothetical protein
MDVCMWIGDGAMCQSRVLSIMCSLGSGELVAKTCFFVGFPCIGHIGILMFV